MAIPNIISYAAYTVSCAFLLDNEGICRRVVMAPKGKRRASARTAARCVGAQYVASLDGSAAGGLVEMPRVGASMLFARVDERGRVSLVRTGILTRFESRASEDPFRDSQSAVATSAPALDALETPRVDRHGGVRDPDYLDPSERTQRIPALRAEDTKGDDSPFERMANVLRTAEYPAVGPPIPATPPPTLPTVEGNDISSRPAGPRPRRSDPQVRVAARSSSVQGSDVQSTGRRRG